MILFATLVIGMFTAQGNEACKQQVTCPDGGVVLLAGIHSACDCVQIRVPDGGTVLLGGATRDAHIYVNAVRVPNGGAVLLGINSGPQFGTTTVFVPNGGSVSLGR